MESQFSQDIKKFNGMYRMPVSTTPTLDVGSPVTQRLSDLKAILLDEVLEIDELIEKSTKLSDTQSMLDLLTGVADLMGDLQVYAASEMAKWGLPLDETLSIIMQSNFSKMGADGLPIYDARGKLLKGPNYWKPEPKLNAMLASRIA